MQKDQPVVGVAQPEVGFHLPEVAAAGAAGLTNVDFQPQTEISKTEEGPHPVGIGNPRMNPMPIPDPEVVAILVGARVGARADQLIIVIVRDKIQITVICLNGLVRTFLVWTNLVEDLIPGEIMSKILAKRTFIKDVPRFLAIIELPTLSYSITSLFWVNLGPPYLLLYGTSLMNVPKSSAFIFKTVFCTMFSRFNLMVVLSVDSQANLADIS